MWLLPLESSPCAIKIGFWWWWPHFCRDTQAPSSPVFPRPSPGSKEGRRHPPFKSPWHQTYMASVRNTHHILSLQLWTVLPKNSRALTKQSHTFLVSQSLRVTQVSKQIRQQNSTTESPLPLSVSPLLSQKWFTPPKNRVFRHGWFWGGTSMLCVLCKCVCLSQRE